MKYPQNIAAAVIALAALAALAALGSTAAQAQIYTNTGTSISEYTATGVFVRNVVTTGIAGGLDITFGPDGLLYLADDSAGAIKKFNPDTGAFLGTVISGLNRATNCEFGADGSLYVSEYNNNRVLKVNASNGNILQTYLGINAALGLEFMANGDLLAAEGGSGGRIRRIDTTMGTVTTFLTSTNIADVHLLPNGNFVYSDRSGSQLHVTTALGGTSTNFTTGSVPGFPYFMDHTADYLYLGSATGGTYRYDINTGAFLDRFGANSSTGVAVRVSTSAAPEPGSMALLAAPGLLMLGGVVRRRRRA